MGGNVPGELGAGTAYCPVCAAYNRYTGHRYRLGYESEAREAGDGEEAARAPPPPCRHAAAPAEKHVDGEYGPAPRVRVILNIVDLMNTDCIIYSARNRTCKSNY